MIKIRAFKLVFPITVKEPMEILKRKSMIVTAD